MKANPTEKLADTWGELLTWVRKLKSYPRWTSLVAIVVIIILLWIIPWGASVRLEVVSDHVILVLQDRWSLPLETPLKLDALYVDNIDISASQKGGRLSVPKGDQLEKRDIHLQMFNIEGGSGKIEMELDASASELNTYIKRATVEGEFLKKSPQDKGRTGSMGNIPPDTHYFKTQWVDSVETRIELSTNQHWRLAKLPIQQLLVEKELPKGSGQFVPRVKSGRVQILNTGREFPLEWSDALRLVDIEECHRVFVEKDPEGLKISFLGKVDHIEAGPLGFQTDLRPRLLEVVYHNWPTEALFIFAILWNVINWRLRR